MKEYQGISASLGTDIGTAFVLPDTTMHIAHYAITSDRIEPEWERFEEAVEATKKEITELRDCENAEQKAIFDTYLLMLSDTDFFSLIKKKHETSLTNIESVVIRQVEEFSTTLRSSGDTYLQERADDIEDIFGRVLGRLTGEKYLSLNDVPRGVILVAKNMRPSDAVFFTRRTQGGILLEQGGTNSHVAILARSYRVPAVVGVQGITGKIRSGDRIIIDGEKGIVITDPDDKTIKRYTAQRQNEAERKERLSVFRKKDAVMADGERMTVLANIGIPEDTALALSEGAEGIGLFRTEFLFMQREQMMGEDEQVEVYKAVLIAMGNLPVTIRTLDAGADKIIKGQEVPQEKNPLLGWRAVRFSLSHEDIFRTQLRALYRAGVYGSLKIMIPLITEYPEIQKIIKLTEEVKAGLKAEGVKFREDVPLGIMIETPSAAVTADILAPLCSFFSIGTNDLTQYTLAVDREDEYVASLFDECSPGVLRLIEKTVQAAEDRKIELSVCGEMAGKSETALLLAGLGVRKFSMSASSLCVVKEAFSLFTLEEARKAAEHALTLMDAKSIRRYMEETVKNAKTAR
ncbi:MAG: phosphoenolpyruvate--protein phosphotransferase [Spirochaetaceae bacterium]|jgi:phosphotransferase system enzyme I (PtsI)|nr:phosphoenolpyruvate--protein phosphotransferase [Spirochaetaceae bacterium]